MTSTTVRRGNPYVGPQAFRRGDVLHGRDRELDDLLDLVVAERIVLMYSPSGAGKTSLIHAGLLGRLEGDGFETLPVIRLSHAVPESLAEQPGVNRYVLSALTCLEEGLPPHLQRPLAELARTSLAQYVAEWPDLDGRPGNEVLLFDQFEEVFTADPVDHPAKVAFFTDLGNTLRDRNLWALFAMREDFIAELDPYARRVPTRFSTRFRLDLLTVDQALDAVMLPTRDRDVDFTPEAAAKLVDDLRRVRTQRGGQVVEEPGRYVEPVQLQVTCRQLWERLGDRGATRIDVSDIEAVGDVNDALAAYYAASVADVSRRTGVSERALRDWFEEELITAQGFRGQVMGGPESAGESSGAVLQLLTDAHLLRAESRRGALWYELVHDRLTQPIEEDNARWRARHLSDVERRASSWETQGRPDTMLLVGAELERADEWAASRATMLTAAERDYFSASHKAEQQRRALGREADRTRRWLRISVGFLALALAATALAVVAAVRAAQESGRAEEAAADAERSDLLSKGLGEVDYDNQLGLLLTLRALSADEEGESLGWAAPSALQRAVGSTPVVRGVGDKTFHAVLASWSDDGSTVAAADADGVLRLLDSDSGEVLAEHRVRRPVSALDAGPDATSPVAVGLLDGGVLAWDPTGADPTGLPGHGEVQVYDVEVSPDGRYVASAGADGRVLVSRPTGGVFRRFARAYEVNGVTWSPDGEELFAVDDSGYLRGWELASRRVVLSDPDRHTNWALSVDVSPDGTRIATGGEDGVTVVSDLGGEGRVASQSSGGGVLEVAFTLDGARVLALDRFGTVQVLDATSVVLEGSLVSNGQLPSSLEASPTEPRLALLATGDAAPASWSTETGHGDALISSMGLSDDQVVTSSVQDATVLFWSGDGMQVERRLRLRGPKRSLVVPDPAGRFLAHLDTSDRAGLTPLGEGGPRPQSWQGDARSLDVSPSGDLAATGHLDSEIRLWDTRTGRPGAVLSGHTGEVIMVDFGTDDQLVSVSADGTVILWDLVTGERAGTIRAEDDAVTTVEWSPVGDLVAVGRKSGVVEVRDASTVQVRQRLDHHTMTVNELSFDPGGERMVSSGDDGYVVVSDTGSGRRLQEFKFRNWVYRAVFSPDGDHLVVSSASGRPMTVWLELDQLLDVARERTTRELTTAECRRYVPDDEECAP